MKKTKISYDKKKDILYIFLRSGIEERFEDISENITVEYDAKDRPVGIEIFNASKILPTQKSLSEHPRSRSPSRPFVVIGIILGGIVGVGIAFVKELFNNTFRTKDQLEQAFGIQVLGVIPEFEVKETRV